jgi:hypothetical protein
MHYKAQTSQPDGAQPLTRNFRKHVVTVGCAEHADRAGHYHGALAVVVKNAVQRLANCFRSLHAHKLPLNSGKNDDASTHFYILPEKHDFAPLIRVQSEDCEKTFPDI